MKPPAKSTPLFRYPLPRVRTVQDRSEQLFRDNPAAVEIAASFFEAGGIGAAIRDWRGPYRSNPDPRPYHEFILLLQGELTLTVEGADRALKPGELAFNPAGLPWTVSVRRGRSARVVYTMLEDTPLWAPLTRHGPYVRAYESADHLFLLLRRMLDAHRYRTVQALRLAPAHARALVDLLKHEIVMEGEPEPPHAADLRALMDAIRHDPSAEWAVPTLARKLRVSVRVLYRLFEAEYGKPPKEVVIGQRMSRAADELTASTDTIEAIAEHLGYESVCSFSRLFKRYMGVSPSAYRRRTNAERGMRNGGGRAGDRSEA